MSLHRSMKHVAFALLMTVWAVPAGAYEVQTHAAITFRAFSRSQLATDPALLAAFDLQSPVFRGTSYFDLGATPGQLVVRQSLEYELNRINSLAGSIGPVSESSAISWIMRGAIREDDNTQEGTPQDAPPPDGNIDRPVSHFFDPLHNRRMDLGGVEHTLFPYIGKAPDWALGSIDAFADELMPAAERHNHFSLFDLREAMWRALTLTDRQGTRLDTGSAPNDEEMRFSYWKTAFLSIGSLLHLNQDMAQPQHTRNEPHSGYGLLLLQDGFTGHESVYEKYIGARTLGLRQFRIDGAITQVPLLDFQDQDLPPIPQFTSYGDYWSTAPGLGSLSGRGLADYSNHGFFTVAHNIGNSEFAHPSHDPSSYMSVSIPGLSVVDGHAAQVAYASRYLVGSVTDEYTGTPAQGILLSRESLFGEFIFGTTKKYTLDQRIYDDQAKLLIPRAVAYSAGLLNHIFRGRIAVALPEEGVYGIADGSSGGSSAGFARIRARVTNTSQDDGMHDGYAVAVAKYHLNTCYQSDLSGQYELPGQAVETCRRGAEQIVTSARVPLAALAPEESMTLAFDFSANKIPFAASDLQLQVVYRGGLGTEPDAVIVATVDTGEPTPFDIVNMTDYFLLQGTFYPIPQNWDATTVPLLDPALFNYVDVNHNGTYEPDTDLNLARAPLSYTFSFAGSGNLGSVTLPPSSFARMIVLGPRTPLTLTLNKVTYGYSTSIAINPVLAYISEQSEQFDTPHQSRQRYVYGTSPDHGFFPAIVPVPPELPVLEINQPRGLTLTLP